MRHQRKKKASWVPMVVCATTVGISIVGFLMDGGVGAGGFGTEITVTREGASCVCGLALALDRA